MNKESITEFDKLTIEQLLEKPTPELIVAIFLKTKQINNTVKWHDWAIKGIFGTMGLGIMAAIIVGIISLYFGG